MFLQIQAIPSTTTEAQALQYIRPLTCPKQTFSGSFRFAHTNCRVEEAGWTFGHIKITIWRSKGLSQYNIKYSKFIDIEYSKLMMDCTTACNGRSTRSCSESKRLR